MADYILQVWHALYNRAEKRHLLDPENEDFKDDSQQKRQVCSVLCGFLLPPILRALAVRVCVKHVPVWHCMYVYGCVCIYSVMRE